MTLCIQTHKQINYQLSKNRTHKNYYLNVQPLTNLSNRAAPVIINFCISNFTGCCGSLLVAVWTMLYYMKYIGSPHISVLVCCVYILTLRSL